MTEMKILESLQYVEDELVEEAKEYRPVHRKPLRTWGGLAACLVLLLGVGLLARSAFASRSLPAAPGGPGAGPASAVTERPADIPGQDAPVPGGVPGPSANQGLDPAPGVFAWTETDAMPYAGMDTADVFQAGEPLTAEEADACAPEVRLEEWMEDFSGHAVYKLADGSGGLAGVELRVTHGERGITYRITLRTAAEQALQYFGLDTDALPVLNGQRYRACRERYAGGDGERTSLLLTFVRKEVLFTLSADVPAEAEDAAAQDLLLLFQSYVRTGAVPDLGNFRYSGGGQG